MAFDDIWIAFPNDRRKALQRRALRLFHFCWIDQDDLFPAAVVGERNAHDVIGRLRSVRQFGFTADEGEEFDLEPAQFLKRQTLEEGASRMGKVMLHRV